MDSPLAPRVVAPPDGSELRIDSQSTSHLRLHVRSEPLTEDGFAAFPAQLKKNPGLITLTQRTLFFTPLLASHPTLTVPLTDITGVKKTGLTKGVDVYYTDARPDGTKEAKTAGFMLVGSRGELFARLVSWGGQRWAKV